MANSAIPIEDNKVADPSADILSVLRTPSMQLVGRVRTGLPFAELEALREPLGLSLQELAGIAGIPARTLVRRRQSGRLDPIESERVLRIERLLALATEMLRDRNRARDWLKSPKAALAGQSPLACADTEVGAREVEQLIGRLRHGVFS
ncbi:MAG: antitoxin Xre/MbcA/ParS toxin-binding domain-containing protein [Chromatiaceae bacterium]